MPIRPTIALCLLLSLAACGGSAPPPKVVTVTEIRRELVVTPEETRDCPEIPPLPDDATLAQWGLFDLWIAYLDLWRVAVECRSDVVAADEFIRRRLAAHQEATDGQDQGARPAGR